jgi:hypothetical protein
VLSLVFLCQACYTYTPIELADVTPEMEIRATVTGAQVDALEDQLPGADRILDGTVVQADDGEILLDVESMRAQRGGRVEMYAQRVRLPSSGIVDLQMREMDKAKTYGLTGAIVAGVGLAAFLALDAGIGGESSSGGQTPQDTRVPLIRIPIGR